MTISGVLLIILGWLLGLFSPAIVDFIRDRREAKVIKTAIMSELDEFRYRLLLSVYLIEAKHGSLDHKFFEWAQSILVQYKGINSGESLLEAIGPLLKLTKDEMDSYAQITKERRKPNSGMSLKKNSLFLLETNVGALTKFDSIFRGQLLEIKTQVGFLNEIIDESRYYYKLSFQSDISSKNYEIAESEMNGSYKLYASRARDIIVLIGKILDKKDAK